MAILATMGKKPVSLASSPPSFALVPIQYMREAIDTHYTGLKF